MSNRSIVAICLFNFALTFGAFAQMAPSYENSGKLPASAVVHEDFTGCLENALGGGCTLSECDASLSAAIRSSRWSKAEILTQWLGLRPVAGSFETVSDYRAEYARTETRFLNGVPFRIRELDEEFVSKLNYLP